MQEPSPFVEGGDALGREEFLRLLVAQLENQNPLEPQQDTEFIAQLATFSSLEQLIDMNKRIDLLISSQDQLLNGQALELVGREVLVPSPGQVTLGPAGAEELMLVSSEPTASIDVEIYDGATRVRTLTLEGRGPGRTRVSWDGLDDEGEPLPSGSYDVRVVARGVDGEGADVTAFLALPVDGLHVTGEGMFIVSGERVLSFAEISEIRTREPRAVAGSDERAQEE